MLRPVQHCLRPASGRRFHVSRRVDSPLDLAQTALQAVHATAGTPWIATIPLATLGLSLLTLPIAIRSRRNQIKLAALRPIIQAEQANLAKQARLKSSDTRSFARELGSLQRVFRRTLHQRHGVHLRAILALPALKIPLWLCFSFTLRSMAGMELPWLEGVPAEAGFNSGGAFWMQDLTLPDKTLCLPYLFGLANLLNIEVNHLRQASRLGTVLAQIGRVMAVVFIPIAAQMPAALCLYWTTSAVFTLVQNLILNRRLPLPAEASSSSSHPT